MPNSMPPIVTHAYPLTCDFADQYRVRLHGPVEAIGLDPYNPTIQYQSISDVPTTVYILPKTLDDLGAPTSNVPKSWSITGCEISLDRFKNFDGDIDAAFQPPTWTVLPNGTLQITDIGTYEVAYKFCVQITIFDGANLPNNAVIIWDPELQNQGGTGGT